MPTSSCTVSFFRNDLQRARLWRGICPVKNCKVAIHKYKVPFGRYRYKMRYLPFCPEHGIRIHPTSFVYYNGPSDKDLALATRRNLMFNADYYISKFFNKASKVESHRLCYESSEDAVSYNVFTEFLLNGHTLRKLTKHITGENTKGYVELYLWGSKIDLKSDRHSTYKPLQSVRNQLESDIGIYKTEPDIMLIIPGRILICIEAKFGSKNSLAKEKPAVQSEKSKSRRSLIERYCTNNEIVESNKIFDLEGMSGRFHEQLFRNIVFASSMAELASIRKWYVVNLRSQHVMNLKRGKPESLPVVRNVCSMLRPRYKKQFSHLTWEDIFENTIKGNDALHDLTWYMKNKTINCQRAFNVI
jgi:hypothetical protein